MWQPGLHLNLKPVFGGDNSEKQRQPQQQGGETEAGLVPGGCQQGKGPREASRREADRLPQARFPAPDRAAQLLPAVPTFLKNAAMSQGSLAWPESLLSADTTVPGGSSAGGHSSFGEAGQYLAGGSLSCAPWGPELLK